MTRAVDACKAAACLTNRPARVTLVTLCVSIAVLAAIRPAVAAPPLIQDSTREFNQAIPLAPGQTLEVNHSQGNVDIASHNGREAMVRATIRVSADSTGSARQFADDITIRVNTGGLGATVTTEYPRWRQSRTWLDSILGRNAPSFAVDYTILVPAGVLVSVHNRFGGVRLASIAAKTTVVNTNGRIIAKDLGPGARLETSFAGVEVTETKGDLTIENSNGPVTLVDADGPVTINDRFGRISVRNVSGALTVVNSNGSIDVRGAKSSVSLRSSFAGITLDDVAGDATVNNSNGGVDARGLHGGGRLRTSFGHVTVLDSAKDVSISASNSRITVSGVSGSVQAKTNFAPVEIRDSGGTVDVDATNSNVTISNAGGAVTARTNFGAIVVSGVRGALTATNANGSVRATGVTGRATLRSSFGPISLSEAGGTVDIENRNGSVEAMLGAGSPCAETRVSTSFGAIRLAVPDKIGYTLSARTTSGRVLSTDVPITYQGTMNGNAINGRIGDGGCALTLVNSNGDITLTRTLR